MRSIVLEDNYGLLQLDNPRPEDVDKMVGLYDESHTTTALAINPQDILLHTSLVDHAILGQIPQSSFLNGNLRRIGDSASRVPSQILANPKLMDELRRGISLRQSVLNPIVLSAEATVLAQELGTGMVMRTSGVEDVAEVYPKRDFLERNPITVLNSKATQVGIFAELDRQNGTNFTPESFVASNITELTAGVARLLQQHRAVMLKESLSCGGVGVKRFSQDFIRPISEIIQSDDLQEILARFFQAENITYSSEHPLVIQEFIPLVISNPSVEMFVPPKDGFKGRASRDPWVTYTGGMFIQDNSYLGIKIPDPLLLKNPNRKAANERRVQYTNAFKGLVSASLAIARVYQDMGYVGIMDCDCGIAITPQEEIIGKVFESNIGRETGGTLPHLLLKKAGLGLNSAAIQVLSLQWGSQFPYNSRELIQLLNDYRYQDRQGGFVVTSIRPDYQMFSGIGISASTKKAERLMLNVIKTAKKF